MRKAAIILAAMWCGAAVAQPKAGDYRMPVDIPVALAGNVGEIRANHFHSGIDIKTQSGTGKNILAAADGYVSRVAVSPTGYGKTLYIDHPNGTTTVYAHLESFNDRIGGYVRDEQYRRQSFEIDLYPSAGQLPVRKGEIIALSGNSGSSGGPHLHFEIRDGASQDPLNVLGLGLISGIKDDIPPRFFTLWAIRVDTVQGVPVHTVQGKYPVVKSGGGYAVEGGKTVAFSSPGYFAVEVIDTKNGSPNTMGLYTLEQSVDGQRHFGLSTERFSFSTTRHINTMVYYTLHKQARYEVYRTYVSPGNELPVYRDVIDRGIVRLADSLPHEVVLRIEDDSKNSAVLRFQAQESPRRDVPEKSGVPVRWNERYEYRSRDLVVNIPAGALYEDDLLQVESRGNSVYRINFAGGVPLQRAMTVSIRPDSLPPRLQPKVCLASKGANGGKIYEGGHWERGVVTGQTRTAGDYFVAVDTIAPRIEPTFQKGADLTNQRAFSLTLRDDFSGIAAWSVEIDGQWALFDYDPKSHTIRHWFRDARYEKGKRHTLKASATDDKGNRREITTEFIW